MRTFLFILCAGLLVLTFAFPLFVYPFGEYKGSKMVLGTEVVCSYDFHFDGTVDVNMEGITTKQYYKISDKKVYISLNKDFEITEHSIPDATMVNMYTLKVNGLEFQLQNTLGLVLTIIYGAIGGAILLSALVKKK